MFKIMIAALLTASTIFSNCNKTQGPTPEATPSARSAQLAPADTRKVTIWFSGLMVFHPEAGKPSYEVGILGPNVALEHEFTVRYLTVSKNRKDLPGGTRWSLEITNSSPNPPVPPYEVGHQGKRRPDDQNGQNDFSWLIDLEGSEFHGTPLDLKPGLLKPIIHLPNGSLFTQYKSVDLKRWQGQNSSGASDFGFVPETIALHLDLHPGQELVLKDTTPGAEEDIFRLPYNPSPLAPPYLVEIKNVRKVPHKDSDFSLYYQLFNGVAADKHFDFKANEDSGKLPPYNPLPNFLRTCCMLLCTEVLLSQRTKPLE
jgi:hypothetical protein